MPGQRRILERGMKIIALFAPGFLNRLRAKYPRGEFLKPEASTIRVDKKSDDSYPDKVFRTFT